MGHYVYKGLCNGQYTFVPLFLYILVLAKCQGNLIVIPLTQYSNQLIFSFILFFYVAYLYTTENITGRQLSKCFCQDAIWAGSKLVDPVGGTLGSFVTAWNDMYKEV